MDNDDSVQCLRSNLRFLWAGLFLMGVLILFGCKPWTIRNSIEKSSIRRQGRSSEVDQEVSPSTSSPTPDGSSDLPACQTKFEKRELREPYQRYEKDQPRFTLAEEELVAYLDLMGIQSVCLPPEFGAPYLNVDWNSDDMPASGRMVSIGFEDLYGGGGWSSGYLLYATYDFSFGTEYEVFAHPEDYNLVKGGSPPNAITAGAVEGFIRYHPGIPMGKQVIMKTYLFPFESDYVAIINNLGIYDPVDVEAHLAEMITGDHPDLYSKEILTMDLLVESLRFRP